MQATEQQAATTEAPSHQAPVQPAEPLQWAVVELMGHARIAGAISQQNFGGAQFVRVDVPEVTATETDWHGVEQVATTRTIPAHTRSFGASAIYSINWCDQLAATVAAHGIKHELIKPYSLRSALASLPEAEQQRLLALTAGATAADGGDHEHA